MKRGRWFLPEMPDVLGVLRNQVAVTIEGMDAFSSWAAGDPSAAEAVRDAEQRGDAARRELLEQVRAAFVTPLEPEDLFELSRNVDWILNYARDLVSESEAMACPPDAGLAEMATLLGEAVRHIHAAIGFLGSNEDAATEAADAALDAERRFRHAQYHGMAALLEVDDRTERIAMRELYRRCAQIGEKVVDTAERVIHAVVKHS
jgi:uncharacterized protein